jgi:hypothetical protein
MTGNYTIDTKASEKFEKVDKKASFDRQNNFSVPIFSYSAVKVIFDVKLQA